jgi:hypothetical protein
LHGNSTMYQFRLTHYSNSTSDGSISWKPREEIGLRRFTMRPEEPPADFPNANGQEGEAAASAAPAPPPAILRDPMQHVHASYGRAYAHPHHGCIRSRHNLITHIKSIM